MDRQRLDVAVGSDGLRKADPLVVAIFASRRHVWIRPEETAV